MKQILHIFSKDARHFWPEIITSLIMLGAFVAIEPRTWELRTGLYAVSGSELMPAFMQAKLISMLLRLIIPVCWWLLVARVVHAEVLVGDHQFWLTRPYEWKNLLAAKLLFLLVFIDLPLLLLQCLLLTLAGFHFWSFVPGLFLKVLLTACVLLLPVFAITTVTSTFARLTGTLLAILAFFIAYISISMFFYTDAWLPGSLFTLPLVVTTCAIVVVLQYATRRVQLSRLLLVGLPVLLVLIGLVPPQAPAMDPMYPGGRPGGNPEQLTLRQDPASHPTVSLRGNREVVLIIPVQVSGVAQGFAAVGNQVRVTIDTADGRHWTSPWQGLSDEHYLPGSSDSSISVELDRHFFDQVKAAPVALHFTLALTQVRAGEVRTIALPKDDFSVPDFGICSPQESPFSNRFDGIACRFALHQPPLTYISLHWPDGPCSASNVAAPAGVEGEAWVGNLDDFPVEFGISPLSIPKVEISNATKPAGARAVPRYLCPGTPLTFTQYDPLRRMRYDLTLSDFRLPDFQQDEDSQ